MAWKVVKITKIFQYAAHIGSFAQIFSKQASKRNFFNIQREPNKWLNGQIIIFLANGFNKGKMTALFQIEAIVN